MRFATFHVQTPGAHPHLLVAHDQYLRLLEYLVLSVRRFHPDASVTVLTNAQTDLSSLRVPVHRENHPADPSRLTLARAEAQWRHLQIHGFDAPVLFLDTDMLVNGVLSGLLDDDDFDVALTVREHAEMPVNSGFLLVNNRRPAQLRRFFETYLQIFRDQYISEASWFGDQRALSDLVRTRGEPDELGSGAPSLRLLPCERYNHSPGNQLRKALKPRPSACVLHFKGKRKRLMPLYWHAHLSGWPRPIGIAFGALVLSWRALLQGARKRWPRTASVAGAAA